MSLLFCFDNFDPLHGELPQHNRVIFQDVAKRARDILKNHTIDDINNSLEPILWMIDGGQTAVLFERMQDDWITKGIYSKALLESKSKYYLYDYPGTEKPEWHEYFAILTLAIIGEASNIYPQSPYEKDEIPEDILKIYVESFGDLLAEAMEAVTIAESLIREERLMKITAEEIEEENRKKDSLRKSEIAIKGYSKYYQLLRELVIFYDTHNYKKYATAVDDFIIATPKERFRECSLAPSNLKRTLSEALSKIKRGIIKIPN